MVKPFQPEELIARINAILRRPRKIDTKKVLKHKRIKFDIEHREIFLDGVQVFLTRTEQIILETLMESIGTVVSKEKIIANVWGSHKYADVSDNTLSAHISNMKKRLGIDFSIYTEYNNGYMLKA